MNETVTLRHPKLPPEQTIRVDRRRMGVRLAAGWVEVPETPASLEPAAPAAEEPEPTVSAPKRRSRKTNEEQ